ncbi:MAG TPA: fibronectin type III domain-containing protein, partial [Candidatus Sulfotelmatobacter sp.]|nr:fibronectin type III domain-containing protein [Candidatus Sulfotelmatobacter sp.]
GQTTTLSPFVLAENAAPGPPLAVSATGGIGSATVSWSPPASSGSSPISGYTITSSPGGTTIGAAATASSVQVNGLTAGTSYTFTVEAVNASGTGAPSLPSGPVIPTGSKKQTVTFASIGTKTMLQSPLTVSPTASSGLPVTLTSSTTPACTVSGFSITFVMAGSCTVAATQTGSTIYAAATPVTRTFTISLAAQTLTFANISTKTMLQSPLTVSPTASSGLPVTLTSSTTPVCTVSGFTITFVAAGSCTVTAAQPGNATYAAAASVPRTFAISKVNQTVTFTNPGTQTLANTPLAVSATATSGLTVVFTTSTPTVCTAGGSNGSSITLLVTGSCSVTASQAGNAAYNAASQARTFSVTQATQAITFAAIPTASLLQVSITMSATASSGLPVSYTTSTATVCTAGGTNSATITLLKAGSCRVVASQAGNTTYKAAANQAQTFSVIAGKLAQTISFAPLATRSVSQPPEALTATASSGLPVTLSTSTPTTCTLGGAGGNVLTLQVTGTCAVTASQTGNRIYLAAQSVTQSFTVTATGFVVANGTQLSLNGQPFPIFGASIYETSNNGATADPDQVFGWATQAHLNTLRLIDTLDEDGTDANAPYEAADWSRTDGLIARAQAAGLHVTIDFSDFRNWWVDRQVVLHDTQNPGAPISWAYACANYALGNVDFSALDPYSVAARPAWTAFMTYVANRVNTVTGMPYRNDPTILVVSMAGEPWGAGSSECGEATSEQELTDFYAWALGEWKSLDPNHLRSNGGLTGTYAGLDGNGHPIPSGQQIDGLGIFDLADNTLPSLHTYPPAGTEADGQTPVLAPEAQRLGKPWFTEEFGWPQGVGDEQRAAYYAWAYGEQGQYGSAGSLFWNLGPQVSDGTYDVDPSTPLTWQVVLANAPGP